MSEQIGTAMATQRRPGDGTWGKTYRYLRTAMVGLLLAIGVSVFYQTWQQDFHLLASVSAYYYTPAQPIFVGGLIGLAACMIALRGTTDLEEVFLNLGGMFAAVVAIVPSSRGKDYDSAVRDCQLVDRAAAQTDCRTVQALADATRANVDNNMVTLLALGLLGLMATLLFRFRDRRSDGTKPAVFWLGFVAAVLVYAAGAVAYFAYIDWFIRWGHYVGGGGILFSLFVVALANARRRGQEASRGERDAPVSRGHYALIATVMALAMVVLTPLMALGKISLLWLEVTVGTLFIVFWLVQTIEQGDAEPTAPPLA
jgi:hypothetical protein